MSPEPKATGRIFALLLAGSILLADALPPHPVYAAAVPPSPVGNVIGRSDKYLVVVPEAGDNYRTLAKRHLGDASRDWQIEDANDGADIASLASVVIPLKPPAPGGFRDGGYQTVPILAYHKLGGNAAAMTVTADMFRRQMTYLRDNDYRVIPLSLLPAFLDGRQALPERAVVITFDDGHQSIYHVAYPILKEFEFPATLFMYTDYIQNGGLKWSQLKEMTGSGIFSIQPHSKTHANLAVQWDDEADKSYHQRLSNETRLASRKLETKLRDDMYAFAYPYGDANERVVKELSDQGFQLGLTVQPGANPMFAAPFMLRRNMIFGNRDMERFKAALIVHQSADAR